MSFRIGNGFDAHKFSNKTTDDTCIILGGVSIPHTNILLAHSDGDVVLHALCDAILGALAKGDIGKHFPDTSAEYENIDSRLLLRKVVNLMLTDNYKIQNVDITIIAQSPRMVSHVEGMCSNISEDLKTELNRVNVKATTTEGMGFTGRNEGIAVQASVLLVSMHS